jgi:hypothetical protein
MKIHTGSIIGLFENVLLVVIISLITSCKKDSSETSDALTEKCIVEMSSDYRLLKVTYNRDYSIDIKTFSYSEKEIIVNDATGIWIYYLNDNGLADSSRYGSKSRKYKYDSDGFLVSYRQYPGSAGYDIDNFRYTNMNGNRIAAYDVWNDVSDSYSFNSSLNLIDIESFNGPFLGKLNNNLISRKRHQYGAHGDENITTNYEYRLNAEGLVIQRTGIAIDYHYLNGSQPIKTITDFEYIIHK